MAIHIVYRCNPRKPPFRVATYPDIWQADAHARTDYRLYVHTIDHPTKADLSLARLSVPWVTPAQPARS